MSRRCRAYASSRKVIPVNIRELIESARRGRSYDALAKAHPESPGRQFWHQIATQDQQTFPKPATIRGIAGALQVPQSTVVLAWAESLGVPMRADSRLAMMLPPEVDRLTDADIATILSVIRQLLPVAPVIPLSAVPDRPATPRHERSAADGRKHEPGEHEND